MHKVRLTSWLSVIWRAYLTLAQFMYALTFGRERLTNEDRWNIPKLEGDRLLLEFMVILKNFWAENRERNWLECLPVRGQAPNSLQFPLFTGQDLNLNQAIWPCLEDLYDVY